MEIIEIKDAEQQIFRRPFETPEGMVRQAWYIFNWPHGQDDQFEQFVRTLENAGMETRCFSLDGELIVKTHFYDRTVSFEVSLEKILPILQEFDVPQFVVDEGDITVLDDHGELISWMSQD